MMRDARDMNQSKEDGKRKKVWMALKQVGLTDEIVSCVHVDKLRQSWQ